jgi:hypothetical protein
MFRIEPKSKVNAGGAEAVVGDVGDVGSGATRLSFWFSAHSPEVVI